MNTGYPAVRERDKEGKYPRKRTGKKLHDTKKREKGEEVTTKVRKQGGFCFVLSSS